MIKFFRKIRQKLLTENKFSKYLLYAIGEIILVVVGILIALQINNFNEQKNVNEFEKKLLISLKKSINEDFRAQERAIGWNENIQLSCEILLKHMDNIRPYQDSLNYHFANATNCITFPITDSEYRNAESYGLQIFKDEETRTQLVRLFSRHAPLINKMLEQESVYYNNISIPVYTELFESSSKGGFGQEPEMIPYDYDALMQNKKYRNILITNMNNRKRENYQMKYILEIIMAKLKNIHPGEVLREEFLVPMDITAYRLSKDIGIPQTRTSLIIKGRRRISADTALRLSRYFGNSAKFWLGLQNDFDLETEQERLSEELKSIPQMC